MDVSNETFVEAYGKLPYPIREYLAGDALVITVEEIAASLQLHVDTQGKFVDALTYTLLGLVRPEQLPEVLTKQVGIPESKISEVITQINEKVFVPIQKKMREVPNEQEEDDGQLIAAAVEAEAQQSGSASDTPPVQVSLPPPVQQIARTPVPIYSPLPTSNAPSVPPSRVQPPANLPGQLPEPPAPRPVPPPPRIEVPTPPAPVQITEQTVPQSDQHTRIMHTMARDMAALKSGADPLRVAHPAPPAWAEAPNKPAPVIQPPAPVVAPQPQAPKPEQPVVPAQAPVIHEASQPQEALRTHLKQYGVDPYREPVE